MSSTNRQQKQQLISIEGPPLWPNGIKKKLGRNFFFYDRDCHGRIHPNFLCVHPGCDDYIESPPCYTWFHPLSLQFWFLSFIIVEGKKEEENSLCDRRATPSSWRGGYHFYCIYIDDPLSRSGSPLFFSLSLPRGRLSFFFEIPIESHHRQENAFLSPSTRKFENQIGDRKKVGGGGVCIASISSKRERVSLAFDRRHVKVWPLL